MRAYTKDKDGNMVENKEYTKLYAELVKLENMDAQCQNMDADLDARIQVQENRLRGAGAAKAPH